MNHAQPSTALSNEQQLSDGKPPKHTDKNWLRLVLLFLLGLIIIGGAFSIGVQMGKYDCAQQIDVKQRCPSATPVSAILPLEPTADEATKSSKTLDESPLDVDENVPLLSADLVPTTDWQLKELGEISALFPPQVKIREDNCTDQRYSTFEKCFYITDHDEHMKFTGIYIKTKPYLGGSRRVESGISEMPGERQIVEKLFGNYKALEILFVCQIAECTSTREMLLVVGDQLVLVSDGIYYYPEPDRKYDPRESPVVNTIISTMR